MNGQFVTAIVGPTATGKSDLGLLLADALGGPDVVEIVNADAYQLYRGMNIGTAKTPPELRRGYTHHQIDVLDPEEDASVAQYQTHARADLAAIAARGRRAVVVGGSGLYVRALLDEMEFPGTDPLIRAEVEARAQAQGTRAVFDELQRLDPAAAASIGPQNTRRIVRALEVMEITGRPYTANLPTGRYALPTITIGLDCDRVVLDERIAARTGAMIAAGLEQEVRELRPRLGRTAARAVGYAEMVAHLAGELTLAEATAAITTNTRRLARKQMGWFGRDPRISWVDANAPNLVEQVICLVSAAEDGGIERVWDRATRRSLGT